MPKVSCTYVFMINFALGDITLLVMITITTQIGYNHSETIYSSFFEFHISTKLLLN